MQTIVMVMAGGKGSRLGPLTVHRAKPAVPFGGRFRIIDFVLSNLVNSGYRRTYVLTQYMASSLIKHLSKTWHLGTPGDFIEIVPAQMRLGEHWYRGTADSIAQNLHLVWEARSRNTAIFGGDHIYKFDVAPMEEAHNGSDADLTIAVWPVPIQEAHQFGVVEVDESWRITGFREKPADPKPMPGHPDKALVSMGNYLFKSASLLAAIEDDLADEGSSRDFGKDVVPRMLRGGAALYAYDFGSNRVTGDPYAAVPYWRDVGTIDSYYRANMELRSRVPTLNLYNREWRIRTSQRDHPPARFVRSNVGGPPVIDDSLVCEGSIIQSAALRESLVGYDCFVHGGSEVVGCLVLSGCDVGEGAAVHNVVMDKNCTIAAGARLGVDPEADRERFPFVTESGLIVLPKGTRVPAQGPIELAYDMARILANDPSTKDAMQRFDGRIGVADTDRHSFDSAGPHYKPLTPGALA